MTHNTNQQAAYFNQTEHAYDSDKVVSPPLAQQLELEAITQTLSQYDGIKNVIDVGCGTGRLSIHLLKRGLNVTAVDISKQSLLSLRRTYDHHKTAEWGSLFTADTLPSGRYDAIVGSDILHHVSLPQFLPTLAARLSKGKPAVFSEPNAWHLLWYMHFALTRIPWHIEQGILQCTIPNIHAQFRVAGFTPVHIQGHGLVPTRFFNGFSSLCRWNAQTLGPIILPCAFRFIISTTKK